MAAGKLTTSIAWICIIVVLDCSYLHLGLIGMQSNTSVTAPNSAVWRVLLSAAERLGKGSPKVWGVT